MYLTYLESVKGKKGKDKKLGTYVHVGIYMFCEISSFFE